jgi:hypothetical protein
MAVEALTMPITQGIWSWDKFLHGGQDFELGLLMIVSCLCLVLLRVQENKSRSGWLEVIRGRLTRSRKLFAARFILSAGYSEHRSQIPPFLNPGFSGPLLI